jgi:hypothetical protein
MGKNIRLPLLPAFAVYAIMSAAGVIGKGMEIRLA